MIEKEVNPVSVSNHAGVKLFSAISLYLAVSWFISLTIYESNQPGVLAGFTSSWLVLLGLALIVLGAVAYFNYLIWVRHSIRVANNEEESSSIRGSWPFIFMLLGLVWLAVFGLISFHGNLKEKGVVNFDEQVVVLGLAFCLALVCFIKTPFSPQTRFLAKLEALLKMKLFHHAMLFALLVFFTFLGIHNGIFWQGMAGDETLDIYAARTIADGSGPFAEYILLHPPMAYLPTAIFIEIGRFFSMGTLTAARLGKLVLFLFSTLLVYISGYQLTKNRTLAFLGAVVIGWSSVFTLISFNSPTKLYVLFFNLVLILCIQYNKWFWAGCMTLILVLSWGGGIMFLPLPFVILFIGEWEGRLKQWVLLFTGFLTAVVLLFFDLNFTNSLDLFYKQYLLATLELFLSKLGTSPYTYATSDIGLAVRLSFMYGVDRFVLWLSAGAVVLYLHRQFEGQITIKKIRSMVSNTKESPLFFSFVFVLALSLVDFQSFLDAIPIIVPASLLLLVVASPYLQSLSAHASHRNADLFLRVMAVILVLGAARTMQPMKTSGVSLDAQKMAVKLIDRFAPDAEIQYLGHLGPLILRDEKNMSRVIHLGPKTMIAMEAEGLVLTDFLEEIAVKEPEFIFVDPRNEKLDYLQPLFTELDRTYECIENPYASLEYRKICYQPGNSIGQSLAYNLILSVQNPRLVEAELALQDGDIKTALASYREASVDNWRIVNFSHLQLGKLRYSQGMLENAEKNFSFVSSIGPFQDIGNLALGSFFQSLGEDERAETYFAGVFGDNVPASFEYQGPQIFSPMEFLEVENPINYQVSQTHFIRGYSLAEADAENSLLTLLWYQPDRRGVRDSIVAIRWIDDTGETISEENVYRTLFYPELGVRWSYLIEKEVIEKAAGFQVALMQEDAAPVFGKMISIQNP